VDVLRPLLIAFLVCLTACGNPELTREDAAEIIRADTRLQNYSYSVPHRGGLGKEGENQGLWEYDGRFRLGEKAAVEIASIEGYFINLNSPTSVSVDVTGIVTMGANEERKAVQFAWNYPDLPPLTKRFAINGGEGNATFALFDDGWRLEDLDVSTSGQPSVLSADEQEAVAADIAEETKKREARAALFRQSWSPTKEFDRINFTYRNANRAIIVTDVDVQFYNAIGRLCQVWYGNMKTGQMIVSRNEYQSQGMVTFERVNGGAARIGIPDDIQVEALQPLIDEKRAAWREKFAGIEAADLEVTGGAVQSYLSGKGFCEGRR